MADLVPCPKCRYKNKPGSLACGLCGEIFQKERPAAPAAGEAAGAAEPAAPTGEEAAFLVCAPYAPFSLPKDRDATIGREKGNDVVLPAKIVSRTHAIVRWNGSAWTIQDQQSSNGTFLRDQPVQEAVLRHGDRVKIGTFEIEFHVSPDGSPPGPRTSTSDADHEKTERTLSVELNPSLRTGISGHLRDMSLAQVLQSLEAEKKTGTLFLAIPTGVMRPDGSIAFQDEGDEAEMGLKGGRIVSSKYGAKEGPECIFMIFQRAAGAFRFDPRKAPLVSAFSFTVQEVLLEHLRRLDEAKSAKL